MSKIHHLEWLNRNALRAFPLRDQARASSISDWALPTELLVDAFITVPADSVGIYLSSVCLTPRLLTVAFSIAETGVTVATATAVRGVTSPWERVHVQPAQDGVGGYVAFGPVLTHWPDELGHHRFDPSNLLVERAILPIGDFPITSLKARLATAALTGQVELRGSGSMQIAVTSGTDDDDEPLTYLTFSLARPEDFAPICRPPVHPLLCNRLPILSINGVVPDENGDLVVEFVGFDSAQVDHLLAATLLVTGPAYCGGITAPAG